MKNKLLIFIVLIISTYLHTQPIIISKDSPYTFSLVSHLKRKPIRVHAQHNNSIKISCKARDSFKRDHFMHSCTIKARSGATVGTFALLRKILEEGYKSLFHVTIEH